MNQVASDKFRWMSFFMSIFVALIHSTKIIAETQLPIVLFCQQLAIPIMTYFFFSSAYFRYRNYKKEDYTGKLKRRIGSLLVPYVCWNLIGYVVNLIKGYTTFSVIDVIKKMIFVYIPIVDYVHEPVAGPLWYVIRLLTFELAAPIFYSIIKEKKLFYAVEVICFTMIIALNVNYYSFLYWMPFYLVGAFIGLHYHESFENIMAKNGPPVGVKSLLAILPFVIYPGFCYVMWQLGVNITVERMLSFPMLLLCMYFLAWYPKPGWFVTQSPFWLYCIHVPLITLFERDIVIKYELMPVLYIFRCLLLAVFISAYATEIIIYKFSPKLFNVLTGKR